jgi:hypothetical protein
LGAYGPITPEAITVTSDTCINQGVFGEFLDKIANAYAGTGRPITLLWSDQTNVMIFNFNFKFILIKFLMQRSNRF